MTRHGSWAAVLALAAWMPPGLPDASAQETPAAGAALTAEQQAQLADAEAKYAQFRELYAQGRYADALALIPEVVTIRRIVLGQEHPDTAKSLHDVGSVLEAMGDYAAARPYYEHALAIRRKVLGEEHPDTAESLSDVGSVLKALGEYAAARPYYEQALAIHRKVLGEEHPDTAASLNDLGNLLEAMGDYAAARPYYEQALAIRRKVLGDEHPDTAESLSNLGFLLHAKGDYAAARPYYEQALAIYRKVLGEEHPDTAALLHNLGALYVSMGDYAAARPYYEQALAINRKVFDYWHPETAAALSNLGYLLQAMGDDTGARDYYEQALAIRQKVLGEEHRDTATSLNKLGAHFVAMGDYEAARFYFEQALAIYRKVLGEEHRDTATSLNNLGALFVSMGDYAAARPYYEQALAIKRKVLGEEHPATALSLNNLGFLLQATGDDAAARPYYEQALAIVAEHLEATAVAQNETGQLRMSGSVQYFLDSNVSFLLRSGAGEAEAYRGVLNWKGATLLRQRAVRLVAGNSELAPLLAELQAVVREWSALAAAPPQVDPRWPQRLAALVRDKERLELALSRKSAAFRAATTTVEVAELQRALPDGAALIDYFEFWRSTTVEVTPRGGLGARLEVAEGGAKITELVAGGAAAADGRLKVGDIIIAVAEDGEEFVSNEGMSLEQIVARIVGTADTTVKLKVRRAEDGETIAEAEYAIQRMALPGEPRSKLEFERSLAAFVVRADGEFEMSDLGAMEPIAQAIDAWRLGYGAGVDAENAGRLLREKLWTPLEGTIGDAKLVLVSPDGALGKLPFAALPGAKPGSYLIEDVALALVPVPQLIPTLLAGGDDRAFDHELLLVGGVDYDRRDEVAIERDASDGAGGHEAGGAAPPPVGDLLAVARSRGNARQTADGQSWSPLPGTSGEAAAIAQLFGAADENIADAVALLSGAAATEERFRELAPRSRILHVATHGFFAAEGPATALAGDDPNQSAGDLLGASQSRPPRFSPGLLSGLVLAGANAPPELPDDPAEFAELPEDGILTAEELMFLPLSDVKLVVLSACETGLGEVAGGEGLLGIQRAFQVAGARTTVATLWKVDDAMTQRLMAAFYRNALEKHEGYLDALRHAQLELLHELREADAAASFGAAQRGADLPDGSRFSVTASPYYWAAFTLSGDWR